MSLYMSSVHTIAQYLKPLSCHDKMPDIIQTEKPLFSEEKKNFDPCTVICWDICG